MIITLTEETTIEKDVTVSCNVCGYELVANADGHGDIYIDPCENCLEEKEKEIREEYEG